jgi:hypothetical protein
MTLCRPRSEPGRARYKRRTGSTPCLVLGSALVFSQAFVPETQFAVRSKAQADCLALEGLPLDRFHK